MFANIMHHPWRLRSSSEFAVSTSLYACVRILCSVVLVVWTVALPKIVLRGMSRLSESEWCNSE